MVLYLAIFILAIALDQITKFVITANFSLNESITVIKGVLDFTYIRNEGAAFGMLQGARVFFIILTLVVFAALIIYLAKTKPTSPLEKTALTLLAGGALGNFIDRVVFSYVRDFIEVTFIDFPVFNIADCFVCIGAGLYILYTLLDIFKAKNKDEKTDE